jgi:Tannase and feruloyl esterase
MNRRTATLYTAFLFVAALFTAAVLQTVPVETAAAAAASCESLTMLALPDTTITAAQTVAAGAFVPPAAPGRGGAGGRGVAGAQAQVYGTLPSFCRVAATVKPSSDSDIKIEVWLPASGWNNKFQAVGNGGWAGTIAYPALAAAVARGYASASTDTGHVGNTAAFALGHPEKLVDMGYRAVHEMTVQAKSIIDAYYGNAPKLSFWNGCSQGGRQGITEAMRYPADFNAIVAGASSLNQVQLHGLRMALNLTVHRSADSYIPPEKYPVVHNAVLEACDTLDGVKDGVLENPARCRFDPKVLECKGAEGPTCLTAAQVETARTLYGPVKSAAGATLFPPLLQPGSESGWATLAGPDPLGNSLEAFKYVVFKDPNWDWHRFNPATDIELATKIDNGVFNLTDPNLKPFFDRGGKLLMYHGWSDPQVAAMNSVRYFNQVVNKVGKAAIGKSIQLYMVPGMNHCQGGPGTDTFDKMGAIEQWVEKGRAPDQIVASHLTDGKIDRTRPLCPYGKVAKWKGSGSTDDAANFACVVETPERGTR